MVTQHLQLIAGVISSLIFVCSNFPMLHKAYKTKNLKSYSLGNLGLSNAGNVIHWLYISSLPLGPIWFLHGFYTITAALMLFWFLHYEKDWGSSRVTVMNTPCLDKMRKIYRVDALYQGTLEDTSTSQHAHHDGCLCAHQAA